ncbi:uncharacterized protein METZ01_LOCUS342412, partial [marine metagenome]
MLNKPFKVVIGILVLALSVIAIMPFLGYHFSLYELRIVKTEEIPLGFTHLFVIRSACFAALAFFGTQYLRRKRPASSLEPILVFGVFVVVFGLVFVILQQRTNWESWISLGLIVIFN